MPAKVRSRRQRGLIDLSLAPAPRRRVQIFGADNAAGRGEETRL
jgi:hypothetical protein